jgi:hypothetical protein
MMLPSKRRRWRVTLTLISILLLAACAEQSLPPTNPYTAAAPQAPSRPFPPTPPHAYLDQPSLVPADAMYFDLINGQLQLTPQELDMLNRNGFVVSDRLAFERFKTAYAYIYWKDLPVLVTTDSILHAIHQTYDDLLKQLESTLLTSRLSDILQRSLEQLRAERGTVDDPKLARIALDLETYLAVPLALLHGPQSVAADTPDFDTYLQWALAADSVEEIQLFGNERKIDFTLFKPRGHYTESEQLQRYFRAMSWLAQIDFRLVEHDASGNPQLNINQLVAAAILRDTIDRAGQRPNWQQFDALFTTFIGRSDNTTLPDLDRFLADAQLRTPGDIAGHAEPARLLELLTTRDYGQQRITGQLLYADASGAEPLPRPVSFMLLGQRFAVDSYMMSNLVFDRLIVGGAKIPRPLPSTLDVMYTLGNDRAAAHLQGELGQYGYQDNLAALRQAVDQYDGSFWISSAYNRWLGAIRALGGDTTGETYPQALRTAAWADKMLHTQLASWAQLRHDNILYVKQSTTGMIACEYPAGYVEPYPEFYTAVRDYALAGLAAFEGFDAAGLPEEEQALRQTAITYFTHLDMVAGQLRTMAEKELRQEPFSTEELAFIKDVTTRTLEPAVIGCGGPTFEERWNGWYPKLFPWDDKSPVLIADVHTNPEDDPSSPLYPPRVLHAATGPVATAILIVDTDKGPCMYVGPAFTYYETIEEGFPPVRLTDEEWTQRLDASPRPAPPQWTASFRLPVAAAPVPLLLPAAPADPAAIPSGEVTIPTVRPPSLAP